MSMGPYRYANGQKYTLGSDGRWWHVLYSSGGDDYGAPVAASALHHPHRHHARPVRKSMNTASPKLHTFNDPWQGNNYARELFQGQGAAYFVGADRLVTRTAEVYAVLYTAAFFAPELFATARLAAGTWQRGLLGNVLLRYFWSGGGLGLAGWKAQQLAEEVGGTTLEMTPLAEWISQVAPNCMPLWRLASWGFAYGAEGPITSVQGDALGISSIWGTVEYGILLGKNEIQYVSATGNW